MAGHSQFKNIMFRKGAQDKKRARLFARLGQEIQIAARKGSDPVHNPALRSAIEAARSENMPRNNIERAIKKGSGSSENDTIYENVTYEGYGPGGLAIIVECLTDNRNRSASQVRSCFSKHQGTLGEQNTVLYQFQRQGEIVYFGQDPKNGDALLQLALEAGAEDIEWNDDTLTFIVAAQDLHTITSYLASHMPKPDRCGLVWRQEVSVPLSGETAAAAIKLLNALEDLEDVHDVFSNLDISKEELQRITQ